MNHRIVFTNQGVSSRSSDPRSASISNSSLLSLCAVQEVFFFAGIFAPADLASLSAIATACLRLFTFRPEEDFSLPLLYSPITLPTLLLPLARLLPEVELFCLFGINRPFWL